VIPNTAPLFIETEAFEKIQYLLVGQKWKFSLPKIIDVNGDELEIAVNLNNAFAFTTYNHIDKVLKINKGATTKSNVGQFEIKVDLRDVASDEQEQEWKSATREYTLTLVIQTQEWFELHEIDPGVIAGYEAGI